VLPLSTLTTIENHANLIIRKAISYQVHLQLSNHIPRLSGIGADIMLVSAREVIVEPDQTAHP